MISESKLEDEEHLIEFSFKGLMGSSIFLDEAREEVVWRVLIDFWMLIFMFSTRQRFNIFKLFDEYIYDGSEAHILKMCIVHLCFASFGIYIV